MVMVTELIPLYAQPLSSTVRKISGSRRLEVPLQLNNQHSI